MYFDQWRLNRWSMATLAIPEIFRCPRGSGQFSTWTECRRVTYQTSWFYKTWSVQASLRIYDHICHPGDVPVPPGKWPILDKNRNPSCDISNFMILDNLACKGLIESLRSHWPSRGCSGAPGETANSRQEPKLVERHIKLHDFQNLVYEGLIENLRSHWPFRRL